MAGSDGTGWRLSGTMAAALSSRVHRHLPWAKPTELTPGGARLPLVDLGRKLAESVQAEVSAPRTAVR